MGLEYIWSQLEEDKNHSIWRISVSAEMDECNEAFLTIGLMEGDVSLMSYDIVYSGSIFYVRVTYIKGAS